ncbi:MAG TPA: hypothetical protein VGP47_03855 [Parachlamydiaceae bacterium]|nr:hypothetical protein [Parachlamydiaceae bacterium]
MLKLERASRNGLINVLVRDKDNLFSQPFAVALGIAIAIHLGLVILFHVVPFKIGMSENVFPPTRVQADMSSKESVIAHIAPAIQSIRGLPALPENGPVPLRHPKYIAFRPAELSKATNSAALSFTQIEKAIYQPEFNPLANRQKKPLEIIISGILAEHELVTNGLDKKSIPANQNMKQESRRLIYSVLVEGKTGKIFWYESKQSPHDASIDKFSEGVLQDMKFAIDPTMITMGGEIEMHFNQETK